MSSINNRHKRQEDILIWANSTFGAATADNRVERIRRFAEEAIELTQAAGLNKESLLGIINHVYSKPSGNIVTELGQAGVSLLALAQHLGLDADDAESAEFIRISSLPPEYWQARQNAKAANGIGLRSTAP